MQSFSHAPKAPALSVVYEAGGFMSRSVVHAKGCQHVKDRNIRGVEYLVGIEDFDATSVSADYYYVAPCARKA